MEFDYIALVCGMDPSILHRVVDVAESAEAYCTIERVMARGARVQCPPGLTSCHAA